MMPNQQAAPGPLSAAAMQQRQLEGMEFLLSVAARPTEMLLRPFHGTLYYKLPVVALSTAMMLVIPAAIAVISAIAGMIPFFHAAPSVGMFGIGTFSEVYFVASLCHAVRLWRRMTHMHTEDISDFEGPALPIFQYIPWQSFHMTRIVFEPLFVLLLAVVLKDCFIIQENLAIFLELSALVLFLKSVTSYFQGFVALRMLLDAKNKARILAKFAQNTTTPEEEAKVNIASFPKDVSPELRAEAIASIARSYDPHFVATQR
jgi:hypothetical protein